jgi:hypothetical protein
MQAPVASRYGCGIIAAGRLPQGVEMSSVEERLTALESGIALLTEKLIREANWFTRISGSMQDFPEFEEVLRLGREFRQSAVEREEPQTNGR